MRSIYTLACVFLLPLSAGAAPPALDYLFPAGARRGTTVEVVATGTFAAWPVEAWIDATGIAVRAAKEKGKLAVTVAADTTPGTHWLRLYNGEGASALRPFLVGTLPEVLEKEPNDDPKKPQTVTAPVVVNGQLDKAGDIDTFALSLRKGQTLVASLEAQHTLGSPMDGVLQVLSADGFVRAQNNDFYDLDPHVVYTAAADGTYLVRLFAFPSVPDASVRFSGGPKFVYRLTLTTGAFADYAYPLAVSRANPGTVELAGWNLPESLRRLPVVPTGAEEMVTLWHPELANAVTVRLEPNAVLVGPQKITLPALVSGKLARPETVDVYPLDARKGQKVSFRLESRAFGFPLDGVLRVTDAAGKVLGSAKAKALGSDPVLDITIPQDGSYRLEVADLHDDGSARHVYLLHAGPPPDYTLKVAADRFTLAPGKPLEIPITVERRGGHSAPVELSAEGLPDGVSAAAVTDKSGKATLRLSGGSGPFSGPFHIVGKSEGVPARRARAALPEVNATTPHLWLTVVK
jgi:hypothetical protein